VRVRGRTREYEVGACEREDEGIRGWCV